MFAYAPEVLERFPPRAVHDEAEPAVTAALASLGPLVGEHLAGAAVSTAVLGPGRPAFNEERGER
jgi:hypothetical protein